MSKTVFDDLIARVTCSANQPEMPIIAVSGFYGAGKTELCKEFAQHLHKQGITSMHVHTDMYFLYSRAEREELLRAFRKQNANESRQSEAYALDTHLMLEHLALMKQRRPVYAQNLYRRATGKKDLEINFVFERNTWILYDGMWILDKPLRQFYDLVLFLTAPRDTRVRRAVHRASQQIKPYEVTTKLFNDIDKFTTEYLTNRLQDSDIVVDTSDYANPSILKH